MIFKIENIESSLSKGCSGSCVESRSRSWSGSRSGCSLGWNWSKSQSGFE
jgi:hypothetical protein